MTSPRKGTAADYDQLIAFLNSIFRLRMDLEYGHIYKPTQKHMSNNLIIDEDNRIISCVGIFPMTLVCGDVHLSAGGIGGVSTDPRYRGEGLMSMLLNKAISMMQRRNYDISILWGDRRRYGHFGWENGGRQYAFNIDRRNVTPGGPADGKIRPFSNLKEDLREIARLYEQRELRVLRTPQQLKSVLNRHTYETWVWRKGEAFAYVTVKGETTNRELIEFDGDLAGLDALLGFLFEKYHLENLKGTVSVSPSPCLPFIISQSSEWGVRFIGMVKILNLKSVLQKFAPQIEKRCRGLGHRGNLTLEVAPPRRGQIASLHFGRSVTVSDRRKEPALRLSDTEMVRLIFGTIPPSHAFGLDKSLDFLDSIFPLDFHIGRLDYV